MADRTESSVRIAAEPAAVLAVVTDFERYPEWASQVREAMVLARDEQDRPTRVRFVLDAGVVKDSYVLDYDWSTGPDGAGRLSWTLVEADLLRAMDGSYQLVREGEGTEVTYRLAVDVRIPMPGVLRRKAERSLVDTALTALRQRVENGA